MRYYTHLPGKKQPKVVRISGEIFGVDQADAGIPKCLCQHAGALNPATGKGAVIDLIDTAGRAARLQNGALNIGVQCIHDLLNSLAQRLVKADTFTGFDNALHNLNRSTGGAKTCQHFRTDGDHFLALQESQNTGI